MPPGAARDGELANACKNRRRELSLREPVRKRHDFNSSGGGGFREAHLRDRAHSPDGTTLLLITQNVTPEKHAAVEENAQHGVEPVDFESFPAVVRGLLRQRK